MFVLHETSAGYALFKINNENLLKLESEEEFTKFIQKNDINDLLSLDYLFKFEKTEQAIEECQTINDGVVSKTLQKFLKKTVKTQENSELIVMDSNLSQNIKNKLKIETSYPSNSILLDRLIRQNISELIPEITPKEMKSMELGLSHHWSSFKIKFSPEKIDTMVIQAVNLLDDLDKEINIYSMRIREWYGWHFPELGKLINDHSVYCQLVLKIGMRENCKNVELNDLVDLMVEEEIKNAAKVSMGSEISEEDLENIKHLSIQTIEIVKYREQLFDYLKQRMNAIAPNLCVLLGELIAARLICKTGSLVNLAKAPGSTIQILGAEKALFRALKTKKKTPKYGLIYHANLIGQAPAKNKGQISRVVASKAALCARVDALADEVDHSMGEKGKEFVEEKLRIVDGKKESKAQVVQTGKYNRKQENVISNSKFFDDSKDSTLGKKEKEVKMEEDDDEIKKEVEVKKEKKEKKMEEDTSSSSSSSSDSSSSSSGSSSESSDSSSSSSSEEEEEKKEKESMKRIKKSDDDHQNKRKMKK